MHIGILKSQVQREPVAILSARNLLFCGSLYSICLWKLPQILYCIILLFLTYNLQSSRFFSAHDVSASPESSGSFSLVLSLPWPYFPLSLCPHFSLCSLEFFFYGGKLPTFSTFPLNIPFSFCPQLNLGSLKRILLFLQSSLSWTYQPTVLDSRLLHLCANSSVPVKPGLTHCQLPWLFSGATF